MIVVKMKEEEPRKEEPIVDAATVSKWLNLGVTPHVETGTFRYQPEEIKRVEEEIVVEEQRQKELQRKIQREGMTVEQFHQKYGVRPDVPEGSTLIDVERSAQGISFRYVPPAEKPTYWYQQVADFLLKGGLESLAMKQIYGEEWEHPYEKMYRERYIEQYGVEPETIPSYVYPKSVADVMFTQPLVGEIMVFESFVHPVPTFAGGLVELGLTGEKKRLEEAFAVYREYGFGVFAGELLAEYGISKGVSKIMGVAWGKVIPKRVTIPLAKGVARAKTKLMEELARVPLLKKIITTRVETISGIGEAQRQILTPEKYLLKRVSMLKMKGMKVSLEEAKYIKELLKHMKIKQIEAGGMQIARIIMPEKVMYRKTQAMFLRGAEPFLKAAVAPKGAKLFFTLAKVSPTPFTARIKHEAVRKFTSVAFWGTVDPKYMRKLLTQTMTSKVLGGVVAKVVPKQVASSVGKQIMWKIPAFVGVKPILHPVVKEVFKPVAKMVPATLLTLATRKKIAKPKRIVRETRLAPMLRFKPRERKRQVQAPMVKQIVAQKVRPTQAPLLKARQLQGLMPVMGLQFPTGEADWRFPPTRRRPRGRRPRWYGYGILHPMPKKIQVAKFILGKNKRK